MDINTTQKILAVQLSFIDQTHFACNSIKLDFSDGFLLGHKVQGLTAWFFWRFDYLSTLPTIQKKLRVMTDWFIDLFFKRDVTRLKTPLEEKGTRSNFKDDKQKEDSKKCQ